MLFVPQVFAFERRKEEEEQTSYTFSTAFLFHIFSNRWAWIMFNCFTSSSKFFKKSCYSHRSLVLFQLWNNLKFTVWMMHKLMLQKWTKLCRWNREKCFVSRGSKDLIPFLPSTWNWSRSHRFLTVKEIQEHILHSNDRCIRTNFFFILLLNCYISSVSLNPELNSKPRG